MSKALLGKNRNARLENTHTAVQGPCSQGVWFRGQCKRVVIVHFEDHLRCYTKGAEFESVRVKKQAVTLYFVARGATGMITVDESTCASR